MKGIILAGGSGTRLHPLTNGISKQLLPIYNKPMIYYPLSVLMLAGIREIMIITTPNDMLLFQRLLGDGTKYGVNLKFKIQAKPDGLAQAFLIGKDFIGEDSVCLILGDNFFYGHDFTNLLHKAVSNIDGACLFGYQVREPQRYGIIDFDENMNVLSLEEKPTSPKSNFAITGLYFYDNKVVSYAKLIKPSERGELEITSINQLYLERGKVKVELLGRGFTWLDMGTFKSLFAASQFVETIENRQGYKIACLEEIGWRNGWLSEEDLNRIGKYHVNQYGEYLLSLSRTEKKIRS
jgi:glucose-1-phosphate thymidylyltransferase